MVGRSRGASRAGGAQGQDPITLSGHARRNLATAHSRGNMEPMNGPRSSREGARTVLLTALGLVLLAVLLLILLAARSPAPSAVDPAPTISYPCEERHWALNTLSDAGASRVDFTPRPATVAELGQLPRLERFADNVRALPAEGLTYRVTVELKSFSLRGEGDIDVIVADPDTKDTMVAEFPNPACRGGDTSLKAGEMAAARAALLAACGEPPDGKFKKLNGTATLVGVALFDDPQDQKHAAPNGLELHPVLVVESIECERD